MKREDQLICVIPLIVYSSNPVEFLELRKALIKDKRMINERSYVIPQYIIEHKIEVKKDIMQLNSPTEKLFPGQMANYYCYYGEEKVTEATYLKWAEENKPKTV